MPRPHLLLACALVFASVAAGCVGGSDEGGEPVKGAEAKGPAKGAPTDTGADAKKTEEDEAVAKGQRWHFHNYWGTSPELTLFDGDVAVPLLANPRVDAPPPRVTLGGAEFGLPRGSVVPQETGTVTVTLDWPPLAVGFDAVNLSYKHAAAEDWLPVGRVTPGGNVSLPVTVDMTDAPHTSRSAWAFRLTPVANDAGFALANGTVHATVVAKIGRVILIDPPHLDHWNGSETVRVIEAAWDVHAARAPDAVPVPPYASVEPADDGGHTMRWTHVFQEARPGNGSLVPEGARTVLARLSWDAPVPADAGRPGLAYAEDNAGTESVLTPESEGPGERLYRLPIVPRMTDNPYGNQSTWRFQVHLEGDAAAFSGTIRLDVWATRAAAETAAFPSE